MWSEITEHFAAKALKFYAMPFTWLWSRILPGAQKLYIEFILTYAYFKFNLWIALFSLSTPSALTKKNRNINYSAKHEKPFYKTSVSPTKVSHNFWNLPFQNIIFFTKLSLYYVKSQILDVVTQYSILRK